METAVLEPKIVDKYNVVKVPTDEIYSDDNFNCRGFIPAHSCIDLSNSIEQRGLDQPLLIQPYDKIPGKKYRIVAGHRRFVACQIIKWKEIPCFIRDDLNEQEARTQNLVENLHRQDLNIKQEAHALKWYLDRGIAVKDIAMYLDMSTTWVEVRKQLLNLPEDIQDVAAAGLLTQEQIKAAAKMKDQKEMYEFVKKIKERRAAGEKYRIVNNIKDKKETFKAKERKKGEIEQMIELLMDVWVEGNLATRFGAWVAGNISTIDFMNDVQRAAVADGLSFEIPKSLIEGLTKGM